MEVSYFCYTGREASYCHVVPICSSDWKAKKLLESYVSKPTALGDVAINHHSTMYHD